LIERGFETFIVRISNHDSARLSAVVERLTGEKIRLHRLEAISGVIGGMVERIRDDKLRSYRVPEALSQPSVIGSPLGGQDRMRQLGFPISDRSSECGREL
jgi:hypothetical protein